jgi:Uma2 family endonuclease
MVRVVRSWLEAKQMTARTLLTYADYAAIPDDGRRYELHDGSLVMTPAPGTDHQGVLRDLLGILDRHVTSHGLGIVFPSPVDCILSDTTVVQPDIVFVATDRAAIVTERAIEGSPSLVVEIVSASSRATDRTTKAALYARHRVPHYWIVDPREGTIEVFALAKGIYALAARLEPSGSRALPPFEGLTLEAAALFGGTTRA